MDMFLNKTILFITSKNLDYLRNTQEINLINKNAGKVGVIGSYKKSYMFRLLYVYFKLIFINLKDFDSIFIGFAPQLVLPLFKWKFRKKKIVIDFFISMYDTLIFDRKKFKPNGIISKILKWIDTITIQSADYVITDTKAHGNYFINEFSLSPEKLQVLYLEADSSIYFPRTQIKPKRMKDKFTILYFGSVLPLQGLDIILGALDLLKNYNKLYFIMIGPISKDYHRPISDNIEYHDWLSQKDLSNYISYADLCLAGHFNKFINKAKRTIPGKAYIYRAMEKPMILGDNEATHELYHSDMKGIYFVKMGDSKALADKILAIAKEEVL